MKKRLHIHSDNSEWAGCENMVGVFLRSKKIRERFSVSFSYRYSEEYVRGLMKWVPERVLSSTPTFPLKSSLVRVYESARAFRPAILGKYLTLFPDRIAMRDLLRGILPDVLHINNGGFPAAMTCNAAVMAGADLKIPRIMYMINSKVQNRWWERPLYYSIRKRVSTFVSATNTLAEQAKYLNNGGNWSVIPNTFEVIPGMDDAFVSLVRMPNRFVFGAFGRIEPRKGFVELAEAWKMVWPTFKEPKPYLFIVGEQCDDDYLHHLKHALRRIEDVSFIIRSPFSDYSWIKYVCSCVVIPSIGAEDYPNILMFAMENSKPVIATDSGGMSRFIPGLGTLVEPGDIGSLATALATMASKTYLIKAYQDVARDRFRQLHDYDKVIDRYIKLWEEE